MAIQTIYFADRIINQSLFKECFQCKLLKFPSEFYYPGSKRCKKCTIQNQTEKYQEKRALELEQYQKFLQENNLIGKKKCPQCNQWKNPKQFSFNSRTTDKLDCWCRDCKGRHCITRYYGTKEKKEKKHQQFLEKNNLIGRVLCKRCKGWKTLNEFTRASGICDKCILKREKKYYEDNKERLLNSSKEWKKKNRIRYNFLTARWQRQQYQTNLKFKLNDNISCAIRKSLKNGSGKRNRHWESLVPYNLIQLKRHLARTMPQDYSWQDFMNGELHIDHIIPIDVFNFTKPEHIDFQRCWALNNLRFLPAFENMSKGSKLLNHFQTCFRI